MAESPCNRELKTAGMNLCLFSLCARDEMACFDVMGRLSLRNGRFRTAIRPVLPRETNRFAMPFGPYCSPKCTVPQCHSACLIDLD